MINLVVIVLFLQCVSSFSLNEKIYSAVKSHSKLYQESNDRFESMMKISVGDIKPTTTMVAMRDGVKLWTKFWAIEENVQRDTLIIRSPYGPDGTENLAYLYLPMFYNVVMQNQRGTGDSEGNWTFWKTSMYDGYDTMEWISSQSWSNGVIHQMGASADGILSYLEWQIPQPHVASQWILFSNSLMYYTVFQEGQAFRENLVHHWLDKMHDFRPHAPDYVKTVLEHEGLNSWWDLTMLTNLSNVNIPALHQAGWYDIFLGPMLETFKNFDTKSGPKALNNQKLIVGPRGHCFFFKADDDVWFDNDLLGFVYGFETSLQIFGAKADFDLSLSATLKKYTLYVMGENDMLYSPGMYWTTIEEWPETTEKNLYLSSTSTLVENMQNNSHTYSYDFNPANPVPTVGGNNLFLTCGPAEQSSTEKRDDVLLFTSPPLTENLAILGEIVIKLYVTSNCTDTDFTAKITDVYPNGDSLLLTDQLLRMRWRISDEKVSLITPGKIYEIEIRMWSTCFIFSKGHSIRLAISSSNFPRFGTNLNNGNLIREGGPTLIAHNSIIIGPDTPSLISLPVVDIDLLPMNM